MADLDAGKPRTEVAKPAPISLAEAEEEAARAEKLAEEIRARALRLRRQAEASAGDGQDSADDPDTESDTTAEDDSARKAGPPVEEPRWWRGKLRLPRKKTLAVSAATVLICASLATSGVLVWQHRTTVHKRQLAAEFDAAARQAVMTLMTIDANDAAMSFQRIIDNSTGTLKTQLSATAKMLAEEIGQSKLSTKVTVQAVAVESMTEDSGVVLVAANSNSIGPDPKKQPPGSWRLSVTLDRDGGRLKMSKVDFL